MPEALDGRQPKMKVFQDNADLLDVSDEVRPRALRIVQAISDECSRQGYGSGTRDDHEPSFQVGIGEDQFMFTLSEEFDRREVIDNKKAFQREVFMAANPIVDPAGTIRPFGTETGLRLRICLLG